MRTVLGDGHGADLGEEALNVEEGERLSSAPAFFPTGRGEIAIARGITQKGL